MAAMEQPDRLVSHSRKGGDVVLHLLVPRLDAALAGAVAERLQESVPPGDDPVVIDLSKVEFIDSSGLGALVKFRKKLKADRALRFANPSRVVRNVLRLTKIDQIIPVGG